MINKFISTSLTVIKWPIALLMLIFSPAAAYVLYSEAKELAINYEDHVLFFVGFGGYYVLWWFILKRLKVNFFSTFEHELSHAIAATLCFCRVTGLSVTWKQGGACRYLGQTNWLIHIVPYFLPTLSIITFLVYSFVPGQADFYECILAFTIAYHITSTYTETHKKQTDLIKVGFIFSFCLLPFTNFFVYSFFLAELNQSTTWIEPFFEQYSFMQEWILTKIG